MIKNALISVFYKDGIENLAKALKDKNINIISSGGTAKYLREKNIEVIDVEEKTKAPEMLDGRVKTLHPFIHGGILAKRNNEEHMKTLKDRNIDTIDLVVVNLYPFFEKVKEDISFEDKLEFIDIGGPTMLRSAAKNFEDVIVIIDPNDYELVANKIKNNEEINIDLRKKLARKVFEYTTAYDAAISNFLNDKNELSSYLTCSYKLDKELRYGENPHQKAAFYSDQYNQGYMNSIEQLNGKELSFNNIKDMDAAWKCVNEFEKPSCVALKHNVPCGVASSETLYQAYLDAYECDSISIFGGIVALNKKVDIETAKEMKKIFLEVIIAPDFDKDALELLKKKKNLRLIKAKTNINQKHEIYTVDGGLLIQDYDNKLINEVKIVTKRKPSDTELETMLFGMKVVKYLKSNAICIVNGTKTVGLSGGQVNRIWPAKESLKRSKNPVIMASDGFFPFEDVVTEAHKYGVEFVIQPGGSKGDKKSIDYCDENNMCMVFTGMRHFKH